MLKVDRVGKRLKSFAGLRPRSLEEFYGLADFIANSPGEFFGELGESFVLAGSGLHVGGKPGCYVDALAVDERGEVVVMLIVPADDARPIERAITAASQIAALGADGLYEEVGAGKAGEILYFLGPRRSDLNRRQRVLLLAQTFDESLLSNASWLARCYGFDVSCVHVALAQDPTTGEEFLCCERLGAEIPQTAEIPEAVNRVESAESESPPDLEGESSFPTSEEAGPVGPLPDPLFDPVVEELASAAAAAQRLGPRENLQERRAATRKADFASSAVEVQYAGRATTAELVDHSSGGVGVILHSPLPVGAEVKVRGRLCTDGTEVEVARNGRVVQCAFVDRVFRLGVAFVGNGLGTATPSAS